MVPKDAVCDNFYPGIQEVQQLELPEGYEARVLHIPGIHRAPREACEGHMAAIQDWGDCTGKSEGASESVRSGNQKLVQDLGTNSNQDRTERRIEKEKV